MRERDLFLRPQLPDPEVALHELEGVVASKDQQIRQLRAALARWGQHDQGCGIRPCWCGLSKALTIGAKEAPMVIYGTLGTGRTWGGETDAEEAQPVRST